MIMAVKPILFTILYFNLFIACNGILSSTESGVTVTPPPQCEPQRDLRFGLIDQRVRVQYSSVGTGRGGTVGDPWIPGAHDTNPCITIYKERHTSATYFSTLVIQGGAGRRRGKPVLISVAFKELSTHQWTQETVLPTNIKSALSKTTIFLQEIYTSKAEALKICFPHASISGLLSVVLNVTACPGVDCGLPDNPTRGTVAFTTTDMGSVATYTCGHYVMVGPSTSTCQSDGDWSDAPSCISTVNCGLPEHPRRATVAFTTTTMGSITTYNCGHYVMVGPSTSTCQSDGDWSDAPSCIIDCGLPDNPTRGTVAFTTTDMGSVATFTCGPYVMVGSSTSTCQSDGHWTDAPSCINPA